MESRPVFDKLFETFIKNRSIGAFEMLIGYLEATTTSVNMKEMKEIIAWMLEDGSELSYIIKLVAKQANKGGFPCSKAIVEMLSEGTFTKPEEGAFVSERAARILEGLFVKRQQKTNDAQSA